MNNMSIYKTETGPENSGDYSSHRVPSMHRGDIRTKGRTAVVIGAGPGGLIAALTIRQEGYDNVIVVEKRRFFTRMNIVNLHPESRGVLKRLGLLNRFMEVASLLTDHKNHVFVDGAEMFEFCDRGTEVEIDADEHFDVDDVLNGFKNETLYSISLADLQNLLAQAAVERGIQLLSGAQGRLVEADNDYYAVAVQLDDGADALEIRQPDLIVVAEGARGETFSEIGGDYGSHESLWPNESWIFGNYRCHPPHGFSHLLFEFTRDCDDLTISNCIFLPKKGEVNVAVTVDDPAIGPAQIRRLVAAQALKVMEAAGVSCTRHEVVWHSNHAVRIAPKSADRCSLGRNVVLVGDCMGSNSPVAALGCTLSTSAYSFALRRLVRDLKSGPEAALALYGHRARSYVTRWHNKVGEIRGLVQADIRNKSRRLARAMSSAENSTTEAA
jgi:2-polyprenyl-6-methoxyphenol hydroxylase-like FAD-dependent oxidoreductase